LLITDPHHPNSKELLSFNIDEEVEFGDEITRLAKKITVEDKVKGEGSLQAKK